MSDDIFTSHSGSGNTSQTPRFAFNVKWGSGKRISEREAEEAKASAAAAEEAQGSELKLVGSAQWTFRTQRNLWMLEELGVPYTHVPAFPRSDEANAVNPWGKIPTLVDGDLTLYESAAINTFLGDKFPASDLVPRPGTTARARYEQCCSVVMAEMDAQGLGIMDKWGPTSRRGSQPEVVAGAREQVAKAVEVLAAELSASDGDYLLGEHFSAADILFVQTLDWAEHPDYGWKSWEEGAVGDTPDKANLREYLSRCRGRPAYARAKAAERAEAARL